MTERFKYTAAEIFKLRMQYKAEFNDLRKTYNEVVMERSQPQRKHYRNIPQTAIVPQHERSQAKLNRQKRHCSPISYPTGAERKSMSCKRQFDLNSKDNLSKVMNQTCQSKKKSLSQALTSNLNRSLINLQKSNNKTVGLDVGAKDKSLTSIQKTCIKIIPKYHHYDKKFLG